MSAPRKRFEDHSPRWQREQKRAGIDPQRWNAWLRLNPKTRKATDIRKYAGHPPQSVRDQRLAGLRAAALSNMMGKLPNPNQTLLRRNVYKMSAKQLRFASRASAKSLQAKAKQRGAGNLFYYH